MTWRERAQQRRSRRDLPSERGFLELIGRDSSGPLRHLMVGFRDLVSEDMVWADSRKRRFRARAVGMRTAALALTAASTVVLGINAIPNRSAVALPMVALVTVVSGLEAFNSWRSRWVLMEEAQYRLNRLRDLMDYYLLTTTDEGLSKTRFDEFFTIQQGIWADVSRRWIDFRKLADAETAPGHSSSPGSGDALQALEHS